jgi:hypothetical protein
MNDAAWDDICVNPHERNILEGRREGLEAGLKAGHQDGIALGLSKGMEVGLELGFIKRSSQILKEQNSKDEKVSQRVHDILLLIEAFPSPEMIFETKRSDAFDVHNLMQRIREKHKVLITQLKMRQLTLKNILNEESAMATSEW